MSDSLTLSQNQLDTLINQTDSVESLLTSIDSRLAIGLIDSEFPLASLITDNFSNPTTTSVMAMNMLWDSNTWDRAPGNSTDGMLVNLGANNDVTVVGTVAHDAAVSGNPILIAAEARDTLGTAVATGDVV